MITATTLAKNGVRALLVPAFRFYIRYVPVTLGKSTLWNVVGNMLQFADHRFNARTVFNMNLSGNTVDQIQRRIYYFGLWEPNLTAFLERRLFPGDLFVDVGANIGYFSLLAAKLVGPTGKVLAIEASPIIFEKLANNIKQNRLNNIVALNLAVSDSNGLARVYLAPEGNIGETTILETKGHRFESEIPCRRLDDILSSEDLQRIKIIKIDVEGAEWSVISGMRQVLNSCPESLEFVIEISPKRLAALGENAREILQIFAMAGFNAYELVNDYSDAAYLPSQSEKKPTRLTRSIEERPVIDLVFSKRNLDTL